MQNIYFENLNNSNNFFINKFKKKFFEFTKKGQYILGNDLINFEKNFAKYIGKKYCIGVGNGLDALTIALKSLNLPSNSEVIVASNAYVACIVSIINANLKPVLIEPNILTYNLHPDLVKKKLIKKQKLLWLSICMVNLAICLKLIKFVKKIKFI